MIIIVIIIISVIIMSVCSFIVKLFFGLSHDDSVFNSLTLKVFLYYILMLHVSYKERQVYHAICKYMCVCPRPLVFTVFSKFQYVKVI